jgi:hypothetical protein
MCAQAAASITYPFPTNLGTSPAEGSKYVYQSINWQQVKINSVGGVDVEINLLSQFQSGQFTSVQSVWIDNQTCPFTFILSCDQTSQVIRVPAFSHGMYPLIATAAPTFTGSIVFAMDANYGTFALSTWLLSSTKLFFLNTSQAYYQTSAATGEAGGLFVGYLNYAAGGAPLASPYGGAGLTGVPGYNYVINSIRSVIWPSTGNFTPGQYVTFSLWEGSAGPQYVLWADNQFAPSSTGAVYNLNMNFSPPLITKLAGNGLYAEFTPSSLNTSVCQLQINYGLIAIS